MIAYVKSEEGECIMGVKEGKLRCAVELVRKEMLKCSNE